MVGYIRYGFCWYKLGEVANEKKRSVDGSGVDCGAAGVSLSAAANIKTPTVSELVLYLEDLQCVTGGGGPLRTDGQSLSTAVGEKPWDDYSFGLKGSRSNDKPMRETGGGENEENLETKMVESGDKDLNKKEAVVKRVKEIIIGETQQAKKEGTASEDGGKDKEAGREEETEIRKEKLPTHVLGVSDLVLTALALEHARGCGIWYGLIEAPPSCVGLFSNFFRMMGLPSRTHLETAGLDINAISDDKYINEGNHGRLSKTIPMVCDLKKCSYKYAFLLKEQMDQHQSSQKPCETIKERMLVAMPYAEEVTSLKGAEKERTPPEREAIFTNAIEEVRSKVLGIRLQADSSGMKVHSLTASLSKGKKEGSVLQSNPIFENPVWDVLRCFSLSSKHLAKDRAIGDFFINKVPNDFLKTLPNGSDDVFGELILKQKKLLDLESSLEPKLHSLFKCVYDERIEFDSEKAVKCLEAEKASIAEYNVILERRREADLAWKAQLEQDMDAVCDICADGEVTPDNQILFCEACNVAVHQKCYGIPSVPEGDYFCHPCRWFERDKMMSTRRIGDDGEVHALPKICPKPLPICCELCPRKQGAFVRTSPPQKGLKRKTPKWVHVVCAKWQGVKYTDLTTKEEVENVMGIKKSFFENNMSCCLCQGHRGAVHKCRVKECTEWMHVTCARSSGVCEVVHGESHEGLRGGENNWTLCCAEHSNIPPEEIPVGCLTTDQLVTLAKTFPPEEFVQKDFEEMDAKERKKFFENAEDEEEFTEIVLGMLDGARCEVCDVVHSINHPLQKCSLCCAFFNPGCYHPREWREGGDDFVCSSCSYTASNRGKEGIETPECNLCNKKGGALRKAFAKPGSLKFAKKNPSAFKKSFFGRQLWCHPVCGL